MLMVGRHLPMNKSGIRCVMASHTRYIEPMLCPKRVNRGQVESSTRYRDSRNTKSRVWGDSSMSKRALTFSMIFSFVVSVSPLYTTETMLGSFRCIAEMAAQRTRSPPPPALLHAT